MLRRQLLYLSIPALLSGQRTREAAAPLDVLRGNIERISRSINAKWGIYIKCLETGEEIALNADEQMDTMSVIKIPLMVEAFRQIEAGKIQADGSRIASRARQAARDRHHPLTG